MIYHSSHSYRYVIGSGNGSNRAKWSPRNTGRNGTKALNLKKARSVVGVLRHKGKMKGGGRAPIPFEVT